MDLFFFELFLAAAFETILMINHGTLPQTRHVREYAILNRRLTKELKEASLTYMPQRFPFQPIPRVPNNYSNLQRIHSKLRIETAI